MSDMHVIRTVVDMLKLSPEQFARMVPDLALWYEFAKPLENMPGLENVGFQWTDDGTNEITAVEIEVKR